MKKYIAHIALALIHALAYILPLVEFVVAMSINNPYLTRPNRTSAITLSTFCVLSYVFTRIYGGFNIGQQKARPIVYQMSLSLIFTDIISYFFLQIMNVNERNNARLEIFSADLLLLFGAVIVQMLGLVLLTYLGNRIYYSIHPPKKCCIVTSDPSDLRAIRTKINSFRRQFVVSDYVDASDPQLHGKIKANEAVILFHLPATVHQELIAYCYKHQKDIYYDLSIADVLTQKSGPFLMDDVMMTAHTRYGINAPSRFFKRIFDIVSSVLGLIVLSPVLLITALAIKLDDGGSVFYRQDRMTIGKKVFSIYKFRTMRENAGGKQYSALKDDDRITRVGSVLRKYRIDELPQLLNILKGEMSVVGPRPEMLTNITKYVEDLPEYAYRCQVKAGLTGYAQIAGKYNTSPRDKLMMDISYIEGYSFWLDIKLVLKTLTILFRPDSTEAFEADPTADE